MTTVDDQGVSTSTATYAVNTINNLIAPQFGFEWCHHFKLINLGITAKAAPGVNFASVTHSLVRGDAVQGFNNQRSNMEWGAGVYDLSAWAEFDILERMHLHVGYVALWLNGVSTAAQQWDFNLSNPAGLTNSFNTVFLHGPMVEFQFCW